MNVKNVWRSIVLTGMTIASVMKKMNEKLRLDIGIDQYIMLEVISSEWYQVSEVHRSSYICKTGDMMRLSIRGYEFFTTPEAVTPRYVLPNRVVLSAITIPSDEEE
mgnify:CR=1 FL=1|tara:strand:+ start:128 stop:445 length:318 start_codon:yes stop_codon:yes gene_type:complete